MKIEDFQQALNDFEAQMIQGDAAAARLALRTLLFGLAGLPIQGSVADALRSLSERAHPPSEAASIVLRAIATEGFLDDNTSNSLSRNVVTLVEKGLPSFANFLKLHEKAQTYEKFAALVGAKAWVEGQLAPLRVPYKTISSMLDARSSIRGSIAHGQLNKFGAIYKTPELSDAVNSIFDCLEQVSNIETSLLDDVRTCERTIKDAMSWVENYPSFITLDYFQPFLQCASEKLNDFITSLQGRFTAVVNQDWSGTILPKRYPLLDADRDLRILIPFKNSGHGAAIDVKVKVVCDSQELLCVNEEIMLGSIPPGKFSLAVDISVVDPAPKFSAILEVEWGEVGTTQRKDAIFEVNALAQESGVDWETHIYGDPYGTAPAEGREFVGRREQVQTLVARMLRRPMEPSYITGQKRVGKTSLATAAGEQARAVDPKKKLLWNYVLWGEIAHEDPRVSLQQLGENIEDFIFRALPDTLSVKAGNYAGSLSPLIKLSNTAKSFDPDLRFVIIIDEFDEMPQELYLKGNLAETLFGNIRALTTTSNICLLLVGGENMPFVMDRQGQKLNKFSRVNLTYFDRASEWEDYTKLIRKPTEGFLEWHEDAISEIYSLTNGNPYFSNVICSKIYAQALRERDVDVTAVEVRDAVRAELSRFDENLFAHLWQDGIFAPVEQREPIILKRKRALAAVARCLRSSLPVTFDNINEQKSSAELTSTELKSVLADFVSREVLFERDGQYGTVLPIFGLWLADVGLTRLASDALSRNLAADAQRAEDEARVLSEELVALTKGWPTYRGRHVGPEEVRAWLEQRSSSQDQRALFNILKATRFLSQADILERIRNARLTSLGVVEAAVRRKATDRRSDIIITYVDGEGKSGQKYASLYAEENFISTAAILSPSNFGEAYRKHVERHGIPKVIAIVDDMVGTGQSFSKNIKKFHDENVSVIAGDGPLVLAFALLATKDGQQYMLKELEKLSYDKIDFRAGEVLDDNASLFSENNGVFNSVEEQDRAKALAIDIGATIYRNAPLGFGDQALSIVFPSTVPNNCLPILHSRGKGPKAGWRPLFERLVN